MKKVIERIRQSKKGYEELMYQEGELAGQRWAKDKADFIELKRLADHVSWLPPCGFEDMIRPQDDVFTGANSVCDVIKGYVYPQYVPSEDVDLFWMGDAQASSEMMDHPEFLRGFVEGALSIWNQVNGEL